MRLTCIPLNNRSFVDRCGTADSARVSAGLSYLRGRRPSTSLSHGRFLFLKPNIFRATAEKSALGITIMERQPHRRRRPALSCLECRRRKIKCDRNDPCAHCVVSKISCTYRAHGHEPIRQQNILQTTTPSASADDISATSQGQHDCAEQASGANHTHIHQSTDQPPEGEPHLWNLLQRGGRPGETSASSPIQGLSETGRQILARQSGLQESQVVLNKTRILGWSHWMVSAPEVNLQ